MQAKLHRWAAADPGRRFDDLFNLVYDPATWWWRSIGSRATPGPDTAGVDGLTVADVDRAGRVSGVPGRPAAAAQGRHVPAAAGAGADDPQAGGSGKLRRLGIPTIADRVVQAALKLVLEPIFEADFEPVSYGFRPKRRAHDAIAEIHIYGTHGYRWVLDADIEACFDSIDTLRSDGPGAAAGEGQARAGAGEGVPQSRGPHRERRARGHPHRHAARGSATRGRT